MGKRLLMILSPYVFLQLSPHAAPADPNENTSLHWIPIEALISPINPPKWSTVSVDTASRLAPRHSPILKVLVQALVGTMQFPAILLRPTEHTIHPNTDKKSSTSETTGLIPSYPNQLKLWGLSLGMTLDLMAYMAPSAGLKEKIQSSPGSPESSAMQLPYQEGSNRLMEIASPRLASVFPRFSYPDVNFWIWYVDRLFCWGFLLISTFPQGVW